MIKVVSMKETEQKTRRGDYTQLGLTLINDFQKKNVVCMEVTLKFDKTRELYSLYQAIYSLIRRSEPKLYISISINKKEGKLYFYKVFKD